MIETNRTLYFLTGIVTLSILIGCSREDVRQYAPTESFPDDTLLKSVENKRAMIVNAHDDDMCAIAGTISKLNNIGWNIAVVSFSKTPERDEAQRVACKNILDTVVFVNLTSEQIRNDIEGERNSYYALAKDSFDFVFNKPIIEQKFIKHINSFKPTIIFTLDNLIGGYGHPEHVLISQMIIDLANEKQISPSYIYQSVYTDHMENSIMERHSKRMKNWGFPGDEWEKAKKIYGVDGMPSPTVQVSIKEEAQIKMNYLKSYNKRERKTIGFFVPAFEDYSAEEYFEIFDREFYRVIKTD